MPLDDAFAAGSTSCRTSSVAGDGRAVVTRWSGRVHVVDRDGRRAQRRAAARPRAASSTTPASATGGASAPRYCGDVERRRAGASGDVSPLVSSPAVHAERRRRFLEAMGPGRRRDPAAARSSSRAPRDTEFPFRQDSDFWYLTGFDHPHAVAVLRTDGGPAYTLFVEPRDRAAETWTGYRPGVEGARRATSAPTRRIPLGELLDAAARSCSSRRAAHLPRARPRRGARRASSSRPSRRCGCARARGSYPPSEIVDPRAILHEMRLRKEPGGARHHAPRGRRSAAEAHREAARLARDGALRVRARGRARLRVPPARRARARPTRRSSAAGATRRSCTTSRNDQQLARRRAGADRRRLRARGLRLGRDAHLSGRRALRGRRARRLRGGARGAAARRSTRSRPGDDARRRSTRPRCARSSRAWSSSACSRATSTS